jgi:phosphoglucomutase
LVDPYQISAANGVAKLIIGQNGILSTPAVSALIRSRRTNGTLVLPGHRTHCQRSFLTA